MKASHAWLRELSGLDASPGEMAERLTRGGIEVEAIEPFGHGLSGVVVADVAAKRPHPERDGLTLVTVWNGREAKEIVCGAPNVPEPGGRVLLAELGAVLPGGLRIEPRVVAGIRSEGMLCSEAELGIGSDSAGIVVLGRADRGVAGTPVADVIGGADHRLEISLTPNRADCLGHVGLARELALMSGIPFEARAPGGPRRLIASQGDSPSRFPVVDPRRPHVGDTLGQVPSLPGVPDSVPVEILEAGRCSRYLGLVVQGLDIGPSPLAIRFRLHVLGQRSIDTAVDVTNYVLLETGHPIHAFDVASLRGPRIVVRLASEGERFVTLDGVERVLSSDDLVIADAERPVALAGVMGGRDSGVRPGTRAVLVESAWFDPRSVRRTARRHGLHTEASHRFERGCDPNGLERVVRRAAELFSEWASGAPASTATDTVARRVPPVSIALRKGHVDALLGAPVPDDEVRAILEGVGCSVSPGPGDGLSIIAPSYRPDLGRPEDLIEEVARVRGYDLIPTQLASITAKAEVGDRRFATVRALREAAAAAGLFEAVGFSFTSRRELEMARVPQDTVEIANPLSEERHAMRTSLLPSLIGAIARAQRHQAGRAALFELGRSYHPGPGPRGVTERPTLALILSGPRQGWIGDETPFDFYDGKGAILSIARALGLEARTERDDDVAGDATWLHPRRSARVFVGDLAIGTLGEVHPDVVDAFGVAGRPVFASLDVDRLVALATSASAPKVRGLPRFPSVLRDLAVVVPEDVRAGEVERAAHGASPWAESVEVFDVYRGRPIAEGHKSLAFRIAYRDPEATMTDVRVDEAHAHVVATVTARFGGALRG